MSKAKQKIKTILALSAGKEVNDSAFSPQVYIGVLPMKVIAINPTKRELETIYNRTSEKEPVYLGTDTNRNVPQIRIDFIVQTIPDKCDGIKLTSKVSYFLSNSIRYNTDKTKIQICNPYGQFVWVTKEEYEQHLAPVNMPTFIYENIRPAYVGEENLVKFLQASINIPNVIEFDTKQPIKNKVIAECRLDSIKKIFTGDIKELQNSMPTMKFFKMGAGAKTTDDNKVYQDFFIDYPMKGGVKNLEYYNTQVRTRQDGGGYPHTYFGTMPYKAELYVITPTVEEAVPDISSISSPQPVNDEPFSDWG